MFADFFVTPPAPQRRPSRDPASAPKREGLSTGPPRITPLRELQLIERYQRGDPEALSELLQAYQNRVYSICYRMVRDPDQAADLTQDTLIKVIEHLDRYDGRAKLSTWIIRIAMNCTISQLRKNKVRRHAAYDEQGSDSDGPDGRSGGNAVPSRELSGRERVERTERDAAVSRALEQLDPDTRALLILRDMQDLDYEQIAAVLDIPLGTVKSRLFRARAQLRTCLSETLPPE
ncbi:MAG: sigma-70 family RNA polymerase sigma factor [Phycisphaerales bacterium]|nr:MAG: sigma-70 family RNA polymerase sigma factor [Phycisphaerales bacterium]